MGLDRSIALTKPLSPWNEVAARLPFQVSLRMINGELAFPDEPPPDDWTELRVGTPAGMITLRRTAAEINLVVWGNAAAELLTYRDAIAAAIEASQR